MFKQRPKADTKVGVVKEFAPRIGIQSDALAKMQIYVQQCSDEVGWLGTAYLDEKNRFILIKDVYLFDQDVHGTTTEITPEGLSNFAEELLSMGDKGVEIWNSLKVWGHSHVNMTVSPSGQDDRQMVTFQEGGHDWFIRLIANKKGDMKLDLYDYKSGITYIDLPWIELATDEEEELQAEIEQLYMQLDLIKATRVQQYEESIKTEMKQKVRKIVPNWGMPLKKTYVPVVPAPVSQKKTSLNVFDMDSQVYEYFNAPDLLALSEVCDTHEELVKELEEHGYYNFFSPTDIARIFSVARKEEHLGGNYHGLHY